MSIEIVGSYSILADGAARTVSGYIDRVQNSSSGGISGTLRIETWASHQWFDAPGFTGYRISTIDFRDLGDADGRLRAGEAFTNIRWTAPLTNPPPPGIYNYFLAITEYNGSAQNDGFARTDWDAISGYYTVTPPGIAFGATSGADWTVGTRGNDALLSYAGPDLLYGGLGDDSLDGGPGIDTAAFDGPRSAYQVAYQRSTGTYRVSGPDGQDALTSVERLQFGDGMAWIEDAANLTGVVHRFYNTIRQVHFYTVSNAEAGAVRANLPGFEDEGLAYRAAPAGAAGAVDVFRFYNAQLGYHFYTASAAERDIILASLPQYSYEGVAYRAYASDLGPQEELYRFYNVLTGAHFFTVSEAERDSVIANLPSYRYEGVAFYVDPL